MPVGAIVAGVGSAVGAGVTAGATKKAANAAKSAAEESNALQRDIFNQNKALLTPFIGRGDRAGAQLGAFLGLGGDPEASRKAFDDYLNSTGYSFQLSQGLDAIASQRATAGLLNSGSTLKAVDQYATNLARGATDSYLGRLSTLAGQGENAAAALTGAGQHFADAVTGENNVKSEAEGNAALAGAANINSLIAAGIGAFGGYKGLSSYGADSGSLGRKGGPG